MSSVQSAKARNARRALTDAGVDNGLIGTGYWLRKPDRNLVRLEKKFKLS
jgi:hypothetical protein